MTTEDVSCKRWAVWTYRAQLWNVDISPDFIATCNPAGLLEEEIHARTDHEARRVAFGKAASHFNAGPSHVIQVVSLRPGRMEGAV